MCICSNADCATAAVNLRRVPGVTPGCSGWKIDFLSFLPSFPNGRYQKILPVLICPPIGPRSRPCWIDKKQRTENRHTCACCFLRVLVVVFDKALVEPSVQPPDRNQLTVIGGFSRQVPESNISGWANFH